MTAPTIVSCGMGVNSVALLVGLKERGIRPDAILFADTGGEKPETYEYALNFGSWLLCHGFPCLQVVNYAKQFATLEDECLQKKTLPSLAFGRKRCSQKYKQRPQHNWARKWQPALECWAADNLVTKYIGIGADEPRRKCILEDRWYSYEYPLKEWGWGRQDCIEAIRRAGLEVPVKSACFFCPAMKPREIVELGSQHPDLLARALAIEDGADNAKWVKGLGRWYSWDSVVAKDRQPLPLFDAPDMTCVCSDTPTEDESDEDYED